MTGKELKLKRVDLELNQAELAEALGLTQNTVSRYETGVMEVPRVVEVAIDGLICRRREKTGAKGETDYEN